MGTNLIVVECRLTKDIEIKKTNSDKSVTTLSLAHNEYKKDDTKESGYRTIPTYFECQVWEKQAEKLEGLKKGACLLINGRLAMQTWDDKNDGSKRQKLFIVANDVYHVNTKKKSTNEKTSPQVDEEEDVPF